MKSKKFLAALAAVAAVSAVATTGLTAQADEEVAVEAAPEAAPVVVETPAAPVVAAPVVAEPVVAEPVAAPEPAETVVTVDETPAAESVATEATAAEAVATEETTAEETVAEGATEAEAEEVVTDEVPDAEKLEDHNGYNMKQLADLSTEATITQETKKAVDYNKIYTDYVNDTVVKNIEAAYDLKDVNGGIAALEPKDKNPSKDYIRKELLGLVSAQIYDFGNDGVDELLTVTREQNTNVVTGTQSTAKVADFMLNLYQYDRDSDSVNLIGRQSLGTYDLTYAGYSRPWGTSDSTDFGSLAGENDSQFQLAVVGDSIYFVQEQNTDLKNEDDNNPYANRITHKVFTVDTTQAKKGNNAISNPYTLNINKTVVTEKKVKNGLEYAWGVTESDYNKSRLYVNEERYKAITGRDYQTDYPDYRRADVYSTQQGVTGYIRDQFEAMKVPVNYAFLVDDVYNDDTIYLDVRFAQEDVTMLTQYNTSPNFTTIDFTGIRGGSHPAGTSEKKSSSSSSNGGSSSSSNNGGTTSSPNTGDSRVPVAAGAAAVAAAAAAVAFVSKKRG